MFRLQRFLSVANFLAIATAAVVLAMTHNYLEREEHRLVGERESVAFSRVMRNSLHPLYMPLLRGVPAGDELQRSAVAALDEAVNSHIAGTSIVKIKVYDLNGNTVFPGKESESHHHQEAGGLYGRALRGETASELVKKHWAGGQGQPISDVLETYVPIRDRQSGQIIGVFEVYSDITPLIRDMQRETLILTACVIAVMLVLFFTLLLIGRRAEALIRRQQVERDRHLAALQEARATLETRVGQRTVELTQMNRDLNKEVVRREQIEVDLRESREWFRLITGSARDAILVADYRGEVSYWNRAAEALMGYTADEALKRPLIELLAPLRGAGYAHFGEFRAELGQVGEQVVELSAQACYGQRIPVEVSHARVTLRDKHSVILVVRDIRERQAAEAQVKSELQAQQIISAVLRTALEPGSLESKLQRTLDLVIRVHGFSHLANAALFLRQEQGSDARLVALTGDDSGWRNRHGSLALDGALLQEAFLFRQVLHAGGPDNRGKALFSEAPGESEVTHYLVPVMSGAGDQLGALVIFAGAEDTPDRSAETLLQMVAHTLANMVEFHKANEQVQRLSLAVEQSHTSILITDQRGRIEYVNPRFTALTGYSREEVQGRTPALFKSGQTSPAVYSDLWQRLLAGKEWRGELLNRKKNGELFWESESISPIKNERGEITHFIAVKEDITRSRQQQEQLRVRTRAMEASNNAICILDATAESRRIIYVNPSFCDMTGYLADEVQGKRFEPLFDRAEEQVQITQLHEAMDAAQQLRLEMQALRKEGEHYWCEINVSPVADQQGAVTHYVLILEDISERKHTEQQLIRLATHDSLTALPNRSLLQDRTAMALALSRRQGKMTALLFIDLDEFKVVNDNLGHSVGDQLLVEVGNRIRSVVRETDTVGRLGGDEFVVLLSGLQSDANLHRILSKLFNVLEQPLRLGEREHRVTCSVGIARYPTDGDDVETLFRLADIAMYQAKAQGGNSYRLYEAEMGVRLSEKSDLLADLQRAIDGKEFLLHYQPKVDLRTGQVTGAEALVRWQSPAQGLVPPGQFIEAAEESGLIVPLGAWVLHEACRQQKAWLDAGLPLTSISVNLSARQVREVNLLELVEQALARSGLPAKQLELEITESMMMENPEEIIHTLAQIRALGVSFAIDDFGTGYSSLAYLKRFPIDRVKIDQLFIRNLGDDPADVAIVDSTITMSHNLRCRVVAEGVETEEQLAGLREMGCDEIQGYVFSRPLPAEQFRQLVSSGRCISAAVSPSGEEGTAGTTLRAVPVRPAT